VGRTRGESREVSREHARYGYTQSRSGGRSRSDASRALAAERSQGLLADTSRALAGRKLEAPPDAEHEPREGETVRGRALTIKSSRWFGLWVSARRFSIRRKAFSGFRPSCPHGHGEVRSFGSQGNRQLYHPRGACNGKRIGRHRGRSGVSASDNESVRGRHGFGEGSTRLRKDQGESASSALKRRR